MADDKFANSTTQLSHRKASVALLIVIVLASLSASVFYFLSVQGTTEASIKWAEDNKEVVVVGAGAIFGFLFAMFLHGFKVVIALVTVAFITLITNDLMIANRLKQNTDVVSSTASPGSISLGGRIYYPPLSARLTEPLRPRSQASVNNIALDWLRMQDLLPDSSLPAAQVQFNSLSKAQMKKALLGDADKFLSQLPQLK